MSQYTSTQVKEIHKDLWQFVSGVSASWIIFKQLYTADENRHLMQDIAPAFFDTIHWALYESVVLGICRLLDPPEMSGGYTISFKYLTKHLSETDATELKRSIKAKSKHFKHIKVIRDKAIAHNDLSGRKIKAATRDEIAVAIGSLIEIMHKVDKLLGEPVTRYEDPIQQGDGNTMVGFLKKIKDSSVREKKGRFAYYSREGLPHIDKLLDELRQRQVPLTNRELAGVVFGLFGLTENEVRSLGC